LYTAKNAILKVDEIRKFTSMVRELKVTEQENYIFLVFLGKYHGNLITSSVVEIF
jgi:hypothetical protein